MGRIVRTHAGLLALVALLGGACSDDDDDSGGAADTVSGETPAELDEDLAAPGTEAPAATEGGVSAGDDGAAGPSDAAGRPGTGVAGLLQLAGPSIAIEARATLRADDVRRAVDGVTGVVARRGGRVASADIDYAPDGGGDDTEESRATLVLAIPPEELAAVVDALEDLGTVLAYDQLAEDVTDRLIDLDSRIANVRVSVARVRALLEAATDIQGIVRLESELTEREIELETLLASQRQLEDRVAMSTLTVEVVPAPPDVFAAVRREFEPPQPGVLEAAADGWGAFVGGAYAVVLVLAVTTPFVIAVALLVFAALWTRRAFSRGAPTATASRQA
jgi:hypothetical protein